jgi:hypothetical protein
MKTLAIFTVASVLGITGAMAQSSTTVIRRDSDNDGFRAGVSVRGHGMRDHDSRVVVRRSRVLHTGSVEGCRTIIVKRTNDMGDRITKKIRKCG